MKSIKEKRDIYRELIRLCEYHKVRIFKYVPIVLKKLISSNSDINNWWY